MYLFRFRRYDNAGTLANAYEQWRLDRDNPDTKWEEGERNYWKTIFHAKVYGMSGDKIMELIKEISNER